MPWWTWLSLGVFAAAFLGGAAVTGLLVFRAFRTVGALGQNLATALEELTRAGEGLERRLGELETRNGRLQESLARLRESLERLSVLRWALGDARDVFLRGRALVPRK